MCLVKLQDIGKDYQTGDNVISPLINLNLEIKDNDRLIIYGKSGSGKTTLLNILSVKGLYYQKYQRLYQQKHQSSYPDYLPKKF